MPYSPLPKHCTPVKNLKGKTTGIMMEGSSMYMETAGQERRNLINEDPLKMEHDSAVEMSPYKMGHDGVPMKDSAMPMYDKGMSMKYDSPVPAHTPLHEGHEDSPATFIGHSGGSSLHQQDPDLSDHAHLLFGGNKLTKDQIKRLKKDFGVVEKQVIKKDTTKADTTKANKKMMKELKPLKAKK